MKRVTSAERGALLDKVEKAITSGKGLSVSDVAKAVGADKVRVASVIRELKSARRIAQGGDRRFARYAKTAAIAKKASEAARTTASGPVRRAKKR